MINSKNGNLEPSIFDLAKNVISAQNYYCIAKEASKAGLSFCCLQEVKYLNNNSKVITLDTGEKFEFHWCGRKKRREAGVGILIKVDSQIEISDPDIQDARVMAINIRIYGFNLRIINVYSPTDVGGSPNEKDNFYRMISKACSKTEKHQKLVVIGDFNIVSNKQVQF